MTQEAHVHEFIIWQFMPITRVRQDYPGTAGDKAFIMQACECGVSKAWDYGPAKDMLEKAKALKAKLLKNDVK